MERMSRAAVVLIVWSLVATVCLGTAGPARAADDTSALTVEYHAPRLSVDARDVSLARVLGEIGARVGFTVVDNALSPRTVSVSIKDASVEEALRQVLRGENHTVLYVEKSGGAPSSGPAIDKIVLLGEPGRPQAVAEPGDRPQIPDRAVDASGDRNVASVNASPPTPSPAAPGFPPVSSPDPGATGQSAADPGSPAVTVGDILKAHAMAGAQSAQPASAGGPSAPSAPPASLEAVLAETTRRAQQSLNALIDGLDAATRSMSQPPAAGRQ
jgi:hypothetical protein